jgi:hypothetical protein
LPLARIDRDLEEFSDPKKLLPSSTALADFFADLGQLRGSSNTGLEPQTPHAFNAEQPMEHDSSGRGFLYTVHSDVAAMDVFD